MSNILQSTLFYAGEKAAEVNWRPKNTLSGTMTKIVTLQFKPF